MLSQYCLRDFAAVVIDTSDHAQYLCPRFKHTWHRHRLSALPRGPHVSRIFAL